MKILETIAILFFAALSVCIIILFIIFSGIDKRRMSLERILKRDHVLLCSWIECIQNAVSQGAIPNISEVDAACSKFLASRSFKNQIRSLGKLSEYAKQLRPEIFTTRDAAQQAACRELELSRDNLYEFWEDYQLASTDYNQYLKKPVITYGARIMRYTPVPDLSSFS